MAGPENGVNGNTGTGFGSTNQPIPQSVIDSLTGMTVTNALIQIRSYMKQSTFQEFFVIQMGIESISQLRQIITAYNASLSEKK